MSSASPSSLTTFPSGVVQDVLVVPEPGSSGSRGSSGSKGSSGSRGSRRGGGGPGGRPRVVRASGLRSAVPLVSPSRSPVDSPSTSPNGRPGAGGSGSGSAAAGSGSPGDPVVTQFDVIAKLGLGARGPRRPPRATGPGVAVSSGIVEEVRLGGEGAWKGGKSGVSGSGAGAAAAGAELGSRAAGEGPSSAALGGDGSGGVGGAGGGGGGSGPTSVTSERTAVTLERSHPLYSRMKYYNRLTPSADSSHHFRAPRHIVWGGISPYALFDTSGGKHGSFSTVFSIWNVMVGSGLLVMPWAFQNAGLFGGAFVLAFVGLMCFYTASVIVEHSEGFEDFPEMVSRFFGSPRMGRAGYYFASWASVLMLMCVLVVYLTMIADFAYDVVASIVLWSRGTAAYDSFVHGAVSEWLSLKTVPVFMGALLYPWMNMRDIGPLVRFNSFGIVAVIYMIGFIVTKSVTDMAAHPPTVTYVGDKWYYLAGLSMVSFFIHNAIIPIIRNKRSPRHNRRDLGIAFFLVWATYASCGIAGYLAYEHADIPQNFLNIYSRTDVGAFIGRLVLFIQLSGVFPLLAYIVRLQVFSLVLSPSPESEALLGSAADLSGASGGPEYVAVPDVEAGGAINSGSGPNSSSRGGRGSRGAGGASAGGARSGANKVADPRDPKFTPLGYMLGFNLYMMTQTVLAAVFFPYIGTVLRFAGAFFGSPYMFLLPIGTLYGYYKAHPPSSEWITKWFWAFHGPLLLISFGLAALQFV